MFLSGFLYRKKIIAFLGVCVVLLQTNYVYQRSARPSNQLSAKELYTNQTQIKTEKLYDVTRSAKPKAIQFLNNLSLDRINSLFQLLHEKEQVYKDLLSNLNVLQFSDLIQRNSESKKNDSGLYETEIDKYLTIKGDHVFANRNFLAHLVNISKIYTFKGTQRDIFGMDSKVCVC
jgi:hypothetical protein